MPAPPVTRACRCALWRRRRWSGGRRRSCSPAWTACSCRAGSAGAGSWARWPPSAMRARAACRFSASASGCRWAVVEYARDVLGWADAHSAEADPDTAHPVIALMPDQAGNLDRLGGTLRPGRVRLRARARLAGRAALRCAAGARAPPPPLRGQCGVPARARGGGPARERRQPGARALPRSSSCPGHPFFLAVQFHPEFRSRPDRPHPLFAGFVRAALGRAAAMPAAHG